MDKMREEFEAWWRATMNTVEMDLHRFVNGYSCHDTNRGWMAWQASRAALCVDMPRCWNDELVRHADELLAALEAHEKFWVIREAELGELSPEANAVRDGGLATIAAAKGAE